ncbi:MAG: SpoIIE family protein phosphatase [Terrimicrobiaceae bacterium]
MSDPHKSSLPPLAKLRHDLRTPVNHILGYSELLAEELEDAGVPRPADLGKIEAAARKILELIDTGLADSAAPGDLSPAPPVPAPSATSLPAAPLVPAPVSGRILVVDDDAGNREMLTRRLTGEGHQISEAADGEAALAALRADTYDLVLLDVMMPVMDGLATLEHIKSDETLQHVPVIMISALDDLQSVIHCIEKGAEDYLPKPCDATLLRARIGACLEKKMLRDHEQAHLAKIEETQRRLEDELQEASRYVVSMLPPPVDEPYRIRWVFAPSTELGGDAFGYHWIDETHFAVYLLDVCGHGVGAALLSVAASNVLRAQSLPDTDFLSPVSVLTSLNQTFEMEQHNNMYFTIWYGVLDAGTRTLCHGCGGHPPALLRTPDGQVTPVVSRGPIVGAVPHAKFTEARLTIPAGSRLFVFSDGAYEIRRGDGYMLGLEDFQTWLAGEGAAPNAPEAVLAHARATLGGQVLDDDLSVLSIDFP